MSLPEMIGIITGMLTIIGFVATVTRYLTQIQFRLRQEHLEAEKQAAEKRISDLEAINQELMNQIAIARRVGTAALVRKVAIDEELLSIMKTIRAQAASIFIPLKSRVSPEPRGLIFLSLQPPGEPASRLRRKIIPMTSSAGFCFKTGKPYASPNSKADPAHYDKADKVSGYRTEDMLNYPLLYRGEVVGVLQLLNKEGPEHFTDDDIPLVEPLAASLAEKVAEFVYVPENLEILGFTPEREPEQATILACDLTQSSLLFREMGTSAAIQHINEFLERVCDIGLSHGATIDKYIGDGVLLKFNVPRRIKDYPYQAALAAWEMRRAFEKLKDEWCAMREPLTGLYIRIGIASGQVSEAVVGHPQYQYVTVFGQPVNIAVNLCEGAPRNRNVIFIDERTYREISGKVLVERVPKEQLGKAIFYIDTAYDLQGIIEGDPELDIR